MREQPGCDFAQLCAALPAYAPNDIGSCLVRMLVQAAAEMRPPDTIEALGRVLQSRRGRR
jgi:hypothetical protein